MSKKQYMEIILIRNLHLCFSPKVSPLYIYIYIQKKIHFLFTQLVKFAGFTRPWPLKRIPKLLTQSSEATSPHKMLWSQQVELEEKARLHSSNPMPNKMMTLYYDPSDPSNPVKVTQYPIFQGLRPLSRLLKLIHLKRNQHQALLFQISKLWWFPTPHLFQQNQDIGKKI